MTITHIFKSPLPSFTFTYKDGMTATFIGGRYLTDNERLHAAMMDEVGVKGVGKSRHPYIYVDEAECEIDSEALTPMEKVRIQAREEARRELLAEQASANALAMDKTKTSFSESDGFAASLVTTDKLGEASSMESTGDMSGVAQPGPAGVGATTFNPEGGASNPSALSGMAAIKAKLAGMNITKP